MTLTGVSFGFLGKSISIPLSLILTAGLSKFWLYVETIRPSLSFTSLTLLLRKLPLPEQL